MWQQFLENKCCELWLLFRKTTARRVHLPPVLKWASNAVQAIHFLRYAKSKIAYGMNRYHDETEQLISVQPFKKQSCLVSMENWECQTFSCWVLSDSVEVMFLVKADKQVSSRDLILLKAFRCNKVFRIKRSLALPSSSLTLRDCKCYFSWPKFSPELFF